MTHLSGGLGVQKNERGMMTERFIFSNCDTLRFPLEDPNLLLKWLANIT